MIDIRLGTARGLTQTHWLESYHTFSFGNYYDPNYISFGSLRVMNEDVIQPGQGFGTHGHQDMEIITYILEGALQHQDSLGNSSLMQPGDIQRMTAGTGIQHSEYNPSQSEPVHLLQIWIVPETDGLEPSYEQTRWIDQPQHQLHLLASSDGQQGAVTIHQNMNLYAATLSQNDSVTHLLSDQRVAWLQVAKGKIQLNGAFDLQAGDGATVVDHPNITVLGQSEVTEILLFEMTRVS